MHFIRQVFLKGCEINFFFEIRIGQEVVLWIHKINSYVPWPFYLLSLRLFIICNSPTFSLTIWDYQIHTLGILNLLRYASSIIGYYTQPLTCPLQKNPTTPTTYHFY